MNYEPETSKRHLYLRLIKLSNQANVKGILE